MATPIVARLTGVVSDAKQRPLLERARQAALNEQAAERYARRERLSKLLANILGATIDRVDYRPGTNHPVAIVEGLYFDEIDGRLSVGTQRDGWMYVESLAQLDHLATRYGLQRAGHVDQEV